MTLSTSSIPFIGVDIKNVEDLIHTAKPDIKNQIFDEFATNLVSFIKTRITKETKT